MLVQCELTIDTETLQKADRSAVWWAGTCVLSLPAWQQRNRSHGLLLSFFPLWFLSESSTGAEEALILNHLFRSCSFPCQDSWRGILSPFGHAAEAPASNLSWHLPHSIAGDIAQVYGSLPRFPETGSLLLSCKVQKPGVPRQCQNSRSLLSSLLRPRGDRLVWSVKNKVMPAPWGVKWLGVQALTWNSLYKMCFLSCSVLYFSCPPI